MNIPKSYEALTADLASEKIISKTLQGQKESYMMLADGRKFDLGALQQRLTVAEQRAGDLEGLLRDINDAPGGSQFKKHIDAALKPAEEGEGSCIKCNGTGEDDSGGVYPWGEGINIQCDCTPTDEIYQSGPEFKMRTGKSSRRPSSLKADQIVEVFGGGETQIARADKTDWRNVEMWRIKP